MRLFVLAALLAGMLVGCGGSGEAGGGPGGGGTVSGMAAGPAIAVEEAIASDSGEALLVEGNLLAAGGQVRLCSALAESFPPQCGQTFLRVEGLKLEEVDGLTQGGDASWTDRQIQLLGVVRDGVLTVSQNATP
jgi:hypothetical protein